MNPNGTPSTPAPPAAPPADPGRDDKAIAAALQQLAAVIAKGQAQQAAQAGASAPLAPPVPPQVAQATLARTVLAALVTGLPRVIAHLAGANATTAGATPGANPAAPPANPRPAPRAPTRSPGTTEQITGMLAARFAAVLGPLAIFGQVLNASNSGMSVLQKSVSVLATTLAPIVLPAAVALAAGLVHLSDELDGELGPALTEWTRLIISATPALLTLAEMAAKAAGALSELVTAPKVYEEARGAAAQSFALDARRMGLSRDEVARQAREKTEADTTMRWLRGREAIDRHVSDILTKFDQLTKADADRRQRAKEARELPEEAHRRARAAIIAGQTPEQWQGQFEAFAGEKNLTGPQRDNAKRLWGAVLEVQEEGLRSTVRDLVKEGATRETIGDVFQALVVPRGTTASPDFLKRLPGLVDELKAAGLPAGVLTGAAGAVGRGATSGTGSTPAPTPGTVPGAAGAVVAGAAPGGGGPTAAPGAARPGRVARDALADVVQSLRLSLQPQASISNLEGVFNQTQLRAANQDPLEQRMMETALKSLGRLEEAVAELKGLRGDLKPKPERSFSPKRGTDGTTPGS